MMNYRKWHIGKLKISTIVLARNLFKRCVYELITLAKVIKGQRASKLKGTKGTLEAQKAQCPLVEA